MNISNPFVVGSFSRDVSTESGTQAITGVGFTPKALIIYAVINQSRSATLLGMVTTASAGGGGLFDNVDSAGTYENGGGFIFVDVTAGNTYSGSLSSFDSDGFTISWTKAGTPTGTLSVNYIAFR